MGKSPSPQIQWFFRDDCSRYQLAEVARLSRAPKDNIQNWVARGMIMPDDATPASRVYGPFTVADIRIGAELVNVTAAPSHAFGAARIVNIMAMSWVAGREWSHGDPMPPFERDVRWQFAALSWAPERLYPDPRRIDVDIVHADDLSKYLRDARITCMVIPIGQIWADLAWSAWQIKHPKEKKGLNR